VILCFLAVILGVFLGGATGSHSFIGGLSAVAAFPSLVAASLFIGYGILVIPVVLFFIIMFARSEWPLWAALSVTALLWWSMHVTIHFALHDSPVAQLEKKVRGAMIEASRQAAEARRKEGEQNVEKSAPPK
jgi:hypothetical protein